MPDVVTCVIRHEGRILLLKRSDRVGTHRGKWAGLSSSDVKMEKEGSPVKFFDDAEGKTWTVHPFLFRSNTDAIKIDWEHTEYRWIKPPDIGHYDTVPKLKEVVESLIPLR